MKLLLPLTLGLVLMLSACTTATEDYQSPSSNNTSNQEKSPVQTGNDNQTNTDSNEVGQNNNSTSLDLSNQGLDQLPNSLFERSDIRSLDISGNNLSGAIPAEIRKLSKLEELYASDNQMTGLPAELGQLSKLRVLDVSNNQLTGLPYELGNLSNLETFNISGNDYSEQDLAIIEEGLPQNVNIIK